MWQSFCCIVKVDFFSNINDTFSAVHHFCKFFGMSMRIVETLWDLLKRVSLLPKKSCQKHLLWALYFLKVCRKQSPGCWAVGKSAIAVDPKMHHKWVWAFIDVNANLMDIVVNTLYSECKDGADCVHCSEDNAPFTLRNLDFPALNVTFVA